MGTVARVLLRRGARSQVLNAELDAIKGLRTMLTTVRRSLLWGMSCSTAELEKKLSTLSHWQQSVLALGVMPRGQRCGFKPPSVGKPPLELRGIEFLRRAHEVLGHPSLPRLLATLQASPLWRDRFTGDDIKQFQLEGSGDERAYSPA